MDLELELAGLDEMPVEIDLPGNAGAQRFQRERLLRSDGQQLGFQRRARRHPLARLGQHVPGHVGAHGARHARTAVGLQAEGRDRDHVPSEIQDRASGVAGVDVQVGDQRGLLHLAHDPGGQDPFLAEGIADRENAVRDARSIGRDAQRRQAGGRLGVRSDHGQIVVLVGGYDLGAVLAALVDLHGDVARRVEHVVVGQDQARPVDEEAGPLARARLHAEHGAARRFVHRALVARAPELGDVGVVVGFAHLLPERRERVVLRPRG